jgi:hypothetical protein
MSGTLEYILSALNELLAFPPLATVCCNAWCSPLSLSPLGLFLYDESTQQHWINPNSLESDSEYQLIGLLLGLAIYNNIILDIRFPLVVYRKLLGCPVDFSDLFSSHPVSADVIVQ